MQLSLQAKRSISFLRVVPAAPASVRRYSSPIFSTRCRRTASDMAWPVGQRSLSWSEVIPPARSASRTTPRRESAVMGFIGQPSPKPGASCSAGGASSEWRASGGAFHFPPEDADMADAAQPKLGAQAVFGRITNPSALVAEQLVEVRRRHDVEVRAVAVEAGRQDVDVLGACKLNSRAQVIHRLFEV